MKTGTQRTLRVAAVQMESKNGLIDDNLKHATKFVDQAAEKGARFIVLPEFMPTGYLFTSAIWHAAEPREGPTVRWLREQSKRLGVWLGTSYLEAEGEDFFNTFLMTNPNGEEAGRVRKQTPALFEAYFFKGDAGRHVIDTQFGQIGVGICYENQLAYIPQMMHRESVDLLVMPHSAPTPMPNVLFPLRRVEGYKLALKRLAAFYSRLLGIPAMMINKSGPWQTPLPGLPFWNQDSSFPGLSTIADSHGTVKAQMNDEEGIIVEDVTLDPSRKTLVQPTCYGRWAMKDRMPLALPRLIEALGKVSYSLNSERRKRARQISFSQVPT